MSQVNRTNLKRVLARMSKTIEADDTKLEKGPQAKRSKLDEKEHPYPSLVRRATAVFNAVQPFCGYQQLPMPLAELISEYSLLPPCYYQYDDDERQGLDGGRSADQTPTTAMLMDSTWTSETGSESESCYFYWFARDQEPILGCRLHLVAYAPWKPSGFTTDETDDEARDRYEERMRDLNDATIELDHLDPEQVSGYGVYRELPLDSADDLSIASLSFYYREFLACRCQCGGKSCLAQAQ
jgi:hypothetical protein